MNTASPRPTTILFVDDDEYVCRFATIVLQAPGRVVVTCGTAMNAVRAVRAATPDLIVSDLFLPDGIGPAVLAEHLRGVAAEVPVLVISGSPFEDAVREGHVPESMPYLRKPFKAAELRAAVAEMLSAAAVPC